MDVVITAAAEADLERNEDTVALNNPRRALFSVKELQACCLALADFPEGFPIVPRFESIGLRRRVHGNYLILSCWLKND